MPVVHPTWRSASPRVQRKAHPTRSASNVMVFMEYGVDKFVDTGRTPTDTRRDRGFHARGGRRHIGHCLLHCLVGMLSDGSPLINTSAERSFKLFKLQRSGVCCVDLEASSYRQHTRKQVWFTYLSILISEAEFVNCSLAIPLAPRA